MFEDSGGQSLHPCTYTANDSVNGDRRFGTTNSHDAVKRNERSKSALGQEFLQTVQAIKNTNDARAFSAANDIRKGVSNIKKGGGLLFAPCPTVADDLIGVGFAVYGILQICGGITKWAIWVREEL